MSTGIKIRSTDHCGNPYGLDDLKKVHPSWKNDLGSFVVSEQSSGEGFILLKSLDKNDHSDVLVVESCTSTMELLSELAAEYHMKPWASLLAVRQESGRGQMRRYWVSEPGNLHVSWLLPSLEEEDPLWNRLLPLMLGWCIRNSLLTLGAETILKWPNDMVQKQTDGLRKTCGLLIEDRGGRTIAGMGMNIVMSPSNDQLRENAAFPAGILSFSNKTNGPLSLWNKLVKEIKKEYQALLDKTDPKTFAHMLSPHLLWMGERVALSEGNDTKAVTLLGLAPDGGLRVRDERGEKVIYSGSISKHISG